MSDRATPGCRQCQLGVQKVPFDGVIDFPQVDSLQKDPLVKRLHLLEERFVAFSSVRNSVAPHLRHGFTDSEAHFLQLVGGEKVFEYEPTLALIKFNLLGCQCCFHLNASKLQIIENRLSMSTAQANRQSINTCGSRYETFSEAESGFPSGLLDKCLMQVRRSRPGDCSYRDAQVAIRKSLLPVSVRRFTAHGGFYRTPYSVA